MEQRLRIEQGLAGAVERVAYGECGRHAMHATKPAARRAMREHVKAHLDGTRRCWKCRAGRRANVFPCWGWTEHWHWGHAD